MRETIFVWDSVNDCVMSELDGSRAVQVTYTNEPQQYGGAISQRRAARQPAPTTPTPSAQPGRSLTTLATSPTPTSTTPGAIQSRRQAPQ
jgi:hypothetical protein